MKFDQNTDICSLLIGCRDHNDTAFDELVRRYTPMMCKVIVSYTSPAHDYDELFCEACVALHTAAQRFDIEQDEVTFGLYARICVRNRIVDMLRLSEHIPDVADCDIEQVSDSDSVVSGLLARETFESLLKSCRDLLSDYEYRVLMLHIQGYKTAAISKMLSRTPKSVDNAKSRIFRRLRAEAGSISDL